MKEDAGSLELTMVECQQHVAQTSRERPLERTGLLMLPAELASFFLQKAKGTLCRLSGGVCGVPRNGERYSGYTLGDVAEFTYPTLKTSTCKGSSS